MSSRVGEARQQNFQSERREKSDGGHASEEHSSSRTLDLFLLKLKICLKNYHISYASDAEAYACGQESFVFYSRISQYGPEKKIASSSSFRVSTCVCVCVQHHKHLLLIMASFLLFSRMSARVYYGAQNDNNDSDRQSRATVTGKHDTQPDGLKYNIRRTIGCE